MSNLSNSKFDFDREDAFDEDVAELEALSDDDLDIDLEGFDFDDIDLEGMDDWDEDEIDEALDNAAGNAAVEQTTEDMLAFDEDAATDSDLGEDTVEQTPAQMQQALENDDELPPLLDEVHEQTSAAPLAAPAVSHSRHDYDDEEFEPQEGDHIPVPRINIDVFCETTEISGLIEATANDRRMAKAHINLSFGGVEKAAQHYQNTATPNLIILETVHGGQQLFDGLARLAEVCDPSTKVVILGKINDVTLYRELMARGISEYLIAPRAPIQITRAIAGLYLDPSAPPIGKNIVFAGTRGGTGSSTICHNVAWAIAEHYANDAVLLDLDLPFGTASLDFAQDPSHGLTEALGAPERLDDVLLDRLLQKCTDRLSLFSAPNMLDQDYDVPASAFEEVLDIVRKGAPNIVIDLPHGWSGWTRDILHSADQIILTATPDLSSYRNAKNLIETINATRSNDAPPILVMNQVGVPKRPEVPVEQFAEALDIEPTAVIPWDPVLFGTAATNAETIFQADAKSKVTGSLDFIAGTILGHHGKKSRKKGFDIKSLLKKL
ncbi:hypothetical protein FF098_008615 [Parvularcula flava]|uniref:Pilus assembly protein CpaE n=1 Tax=Aquisalinus luteolus TaxID=1566827 RepID=A0A8J3A3X5_9PROT|nr:AAA family ATPase [Aquisalinus luteolus]NHK27963.1 hypothetical protein [Aquisalinus luteolus]GGH97061.1 pilus assembly protein CpaE [Aquisalinus luteolus]